MQCFSSTYYIASASVFYPSRPQKKSAKPSAFYRFENPQVCRSAFHRMPIDIVDSLWHNVKANGFVFDKLHLVVAPQSDHTVTRKDDLLVKPTLFDFLISTNRQL